MEIILYSTHCPKCNILEKKLNEKNISFRLETEIEKMPKQVINSNTVPWLKVNDCLMNFGEAVKWVNSYGN